MLEANSALTALNLNKNALGTDGLVAIARGAPLRPPPFRRSALGPREAVSLSISAVLRHMLCDRLACDSKGPTAGSFIDCARGGGLLCPC